MTYDWNTVPYPTCYWYSFRLFHFSCSLSEGLCLFLSRHSVLFQMNDANPPSHNQWIKDLMQNIELEKPDTVNTWLYSEILQNPGCVISLDRIDCINSLVGLEVWIYLSYLCLNIVWCTVLFCLCVCFPVCHVYIFLDDYCLRQCLVW